MILSSFFSLHDYIFLSLLAFSLVTDLSENKIPNFLTATLLIAGLFAQFQLNGLLGLVSGGSGVLLGFLLFFPFHLLGGMRGGDVKLMAASGAYLGMNVIIASGLSLLAGSILGLVILLYRQGFSSYLNRYKTMALMFFGFGRLEYIEPEEHEVAAQSFPYAASIVAGCLLTILIFR